MAIKLTHCPMCSGARALKALADLSAEHGPLKITLRDLPVLQCPKNHNAPVHSDFMLWLIQEIRARAGAIAAGKEQGMLFKKHLCGDCGRELAAKPDRRQAFLYDLKFEELAPFGLAVEMPMYKCTGCGKEQIRSTKDLHSHAAGAIVGINDKAGFPHSG
jgi:hypothetical protein